MQIYKIFRRFINYYQKKGFLKTVSRIFEQFYRILFKSKTVLFFADMSEVDNSKLKLPQDIVIEYKESFNQALQSDMKKMINYWEDIMEMDRARERFEKGAILWIIKSKADIAGFGWSIRGKMVSPYHLPITPNDVVLFDFFTFEEYRGHGFYALLLENIKGKMKLEGVSRVYGHSYEWNRSSIHGLEKGNMHKFIVTRKFHFWGRNITIWSYVNSSYR